MASSTGSAPIVLGGRYVLGGLLGRGAVGTVHAAYDTVLERDVAVKVWRGADGDPRTIERLAREARAAGRLSGPRVVAVLDVDPTAEPPYLVMERLPGVTWADVLRDAVPGDATSTAVLVEVLAALADAHATGVVHRDVKPANVLLSEDGRAKLGDFGIATAVDDTRLTRSGDVVGTAPYLAPERLHDAEPTAACDVWSVGVMAYEAFSGRRPFDGDSPIAAARSVLHGDHPPLDALRPDLPDDVLGIVAAALAREPADRPDAATFRWTLEVTLPPTDGRGDPMLAAFVGQALERRADLAAPAAGGPGPGARPADGTTVLGGLSGVALLERLVGAPADRTGAGPARPPSPLRRFAPAAAVVLAAAAAGVGLGQAVGGGDGSSAAGSGTPRPAPTTAGAAALPPPTTSGPTARTVAVRTTSAAPTRPPPPLRTTSTRARDARTTVSDRRVGHAAGAKKGKKAGKDKKAGKGDKAGKGRDHGDG